MISEPEFKRAVRHWILRGNPKISQHQLDDDTPIIEQRMITSLQVMDLILFVEQLTGNDVTEEQLKPGTFRSINAISKSFLREVRDV